MRTLWIFCTDLAARSKRCLLTQHKVLLLKDEVQPSCFAQERVRLSNWGLLVGVAVHLQRRLRFRFEEGERVDKNRRAANGKKGKNEPRQTRLSRKCR